MLMFINLFMLKIVTLPGKFPSDAHVTGVDFVAYFCKFYGAIPSHLSWVLRANFSPNLRALFRYAWHETLFCQSHSLEFRAVAKIANFLNFPHPFTTFPHIFPI